MLLVPMSFGGVAALLCPAINKDPATRESTSRVCRQKGNIFAFRAKTHLPREPHVRRHVFKSHEIPPKVWLARNCYNLSWEHLKLPLV